MKRVNALLAVALALGGGTVQAGLTNPGFEENSLNGWIPNPGNGDFSVVQSSDAESYTLPDGITVIPAYTYLPPEGAYFLKMGNSSGAPGEWHTVSQSVELLAGQSLSGYFGFDWNDIDPFLDSARVRILQGADVVYEPFNFEGIPNLAPPPDYLDYAYFPWHDWSWTAKDPGTYTIEYGVANGADDSINSFAYFDAAPAAVPEPLSLALFAIGLASLGGIQRRRAISISRFS